MFSSLVKNTQWGPMMSLLSPAFFDVIPARMLIREVRGLSARYLSPATFASACEERSRLLEGARLPFTIVTSLPGRRDVADEAERGSDLLALYFHQVLGEGPALLDLRRRAFERVDGRWLWRPEPALADWDPNFRAACRDLYRGFYLDDAVRFSAGARALGLGEAEAELRAQFGDTRHVSFSLRDFQKRFHQVFERCKATSSKLNPGFLTLGLALATLYEHLETVGAPLDVRAAFDRVHRGTSQAPG